MKCEILKRTAIALFVGSVISTYSVAETGKIYENSSPREVANAINENSKRITAVEEELTTKADEAYVDSLQNITRNHTKNIKALSEGIRDNVLPAIEANRSDIDNLGNTVNDLGNTVNDLGDAVITLDEHLAGTQDAVAENRKDIDALKADKTELAAKADKTELAAKADKTELAAKADKTELAAKADKTELAAKADKTELAAKADKTELAAKADKTELAAKADKTELAAKADKTELAAKADKTELAAKADKTELANKADKNSVYSKSETDNKFALKADNSVVSAQAVDINNLRTDVNAHKVDINKLRTDVNTHTKRLDHLDNRVNKLDKDLKRGLAAQAALTGLFQPYTVGKANFTAAVGGYKSQTAVAIGTGYRYNQNIATKAGVAFTQGGGVTYNAGVNFEW